MKHYLFNLWRKLRANFWLLPSFMVVLTILLSALTLRIDHALENVDLSPYISFIWEGDAQSAELLLSTIYYDHNKQLRLISKQINFSGLTDAAFNQIRQYGSQSATVIIHLLDVFRYIVISDQTKEQI